MDRGIGGLGEVKKEGMNGGTKRKEDSPVAWIRRR